MSAGENIGMILGIGLIFSVFGFLLALTGTPAVLVIALFVGALLLVGFIFGTITAFVNFGKIIDLGLDNTRKGD